MSIVSNSLNISIPSSRYSSSFLEIVPEIYEYYQKVIKKSFTEVKEFFSPPEGFEPPTGWLTATCSTD